MYLLYQRINYIQNKFYILGDFDTIKTVDIVVGKTSFFFLRFAR